MKKNKYKFKKWFLIPIFLLVCSLVFGFGYSKPANAITMGFNDNVGFSDWYTTLPDEILLEERVNYVSITIPIDTNFPTDYVNSSGQNTNNVVFARGPIDIDALNFNSNVFLTARNDYINSFDYDFYGNIVGFNGWGPAGFGTPLAVEFRYNDFIFPYGYTGSELSEYGYSRPIRTSEQLNMINSEFFVDMAVMLYKPIGISDYNVHFNNVYLEYAVMKPEAFNSNGLTGISNNISYNSYNWTFSNDNNNYLNPYDNTLYPILTETDQYYKIDLYNLLRMVIDTEYENNFSNGEYVGKYLVYFPYISVNGYTDALTLTSNYIIATTGSSVASINSFYNDENVPFSSLYINSLDYMSYNNYVTPNLVRVEPTDMTSWLVTSVGAFINAEIFPGFAIGGILAVLIALPLAIWLIKIILGG